MPNSKQETNLNGSGFTIVELVVVIVILGILAAAALPRFVNLAEDAHSANVDAMSSSFQSGVQLVHAKWISKGAAATVNSVTVEGGGSIGVNDSGWPENTLAEGGDGKATSAECVSLWTGLLNSAPGVSATAGAAAWLASVRGAATCRYTNDTAAGRYFDYDTSNGVLTTGVDTSASTASTSTPKSSGVVTPSSASPPSAASGAAESGVACGLIGVEPFLVLALVRRNRALEKH